MNSLYHLPKIVERADTNYANYAYEYALSISRKDVRILLKVIQEMSEMYQMSVMESKDDGIHEE